MKVEKTCAVDDIEVYRTEAIYARKIYLMSTSSIKIEDVNLDMRLNQERSELKNTRKTEFSNRQSQKL